jgi:hypothetical protein
MHCRLARLAEFGSGRARLLLDTSSADLSPRAEEPSAATSELPFGQPILVTCTADDGQGEVDAD